MLKHVSLLPSSPQTNKALNVISGKQLKILSWTPYVNIKIGTKENRNTTFHTCKVHSFDNKRLTLHAQLNVHSAHVDHVLKKWTIINKDTRIGY